MVDSVGRTVMVQGRIVWVVGNLFKGRPKLDFNTRQPKLGKDGQPQTEFGFGLSVPKSALTSDPAQIWQAMHDEAFTLFPSRQIPPSFAMKYKDGDTIDDEGKPFALRAGYAGAIVFAMTTTIPIKFFRHENGQNVMINDGIKCGDYVQVQLNIKAHPAQGTGKAGLYLNPMACLFLGYGEEIINTPSGDQIFGTAAPSLPPGASAMPIAPTGMLVSSGPPTFANPGYPQQPVQAPMGYQPPMQTQAPPQYPGMQVGGQPAFNPSMTPPSVAAPAPAPHYGVLPAVHQPQSQPQQFAPPGMPQAQYQPQPAPMQQPAQYAQPGMPQAQPAAFPGSPAMPGFPVPR